MSFLKIIEFNCLKQWAWREPNMDLNLFKNLVCLYKRYIFFLSFFNQYNTLEVAIGIKPAPSTMNPILKKWVQSCGVSITLEPFITALNFEILFYKF